MRLLLFLLLFLFLFLLLFVLSSSSPHKICPSPLFRQSRSSIPPNGTSPHHSAPIHFFAITQDCQFVLARPDQLGQLPTLSVTSSPSFSDCSPSRINLLWSLNSPNPSLLLLQKRAHNKICLLPVEVPLEVIAYGTELFRYSLRNALRHFAICFSSNSSSLFLDPNLIFADSLYSDILYFLDTFSSVDSLWTVHQFHFSSSGRFRLRNTFERIKPMLQQNISFQKNSPRGLSPFLLASDAQRKRLFAVPRAQNDLEAEKSIKWTCPFDLIFRPHLAHFHSLSLFPRSNSLLSSDSQLSGFAIDRNVAIFTESVRNSRDTFVFVAKFRGKNVKSPLLAESHCVLKLPFGAKFGVISDQTLKELREKGSLPILGENEQKERPLEMPKFTTESATLIRDEESTDVTSREFALNAPRGHIISLPKAQTVSIKATTKKVVVDRIEPFWKTTAAEAKTTSTEAEKKMRLEEDEGEGEEEEWGDDYGQWRDQIAEGHDDKGKSKLMLPLREDGGMGPAQLRAKVPSGDKSANGKGQQQKMNGTRREAHGIMALLLFIILFLI